MTNDKIPLARLVNLFKFHHPGQPAAQGFLYQHLNFLKQFSELLG